MFKLTKTQTPAGPLLEQILSAGKRVTRLDSTDWFGDYLDQHAERIAIDLEMLTKALTAPARVLDVGCCPPFLMAALNDLGYAVTGIDLSATVVERSRQLLGLDVVQCDIERQRLPFEDQSFDAVLLCEVFEHLRINPVFTMSEIYRVLRPGGLLHLSTPNLFSLAGLQSLLLHRRSHFWASNDLYDELNMINTFGFAGHIREYTYREVERFVLRLGFARATCLFRLGGTKRWTQAVYAVAPFLRPNVVVEAWK